MEWISKPLPASLEHQVKLSFTLLKNEMLVISGVIVVMFVDNDADPQALLMVAFIVPDPATVLTTVTVVDVAEPEMLKSPVTLHDTLMPEGNPVIL